MRLRKATSWRNSVTPDAGDTTRSRRAKGFVEIVWSPAALARLQEICTPSPRGPSLFHPRACDRRNSLRRALPRERQSRDCPNGLAWGAAQVTLAWLALQTDHRAQIGRGHAR